MISSHHDTRKAWQGRAKSDERQPTYTERGQHHYGRQGADRESTPEKKPAPAGVVVTRHAGHPARGVVLQRHVRRCMGDGRKSKIESQKARTRQMIVGRQTGVCLRDEKAEAEFMIVVRVLASARNM